MKKRLSPQLVLTSLLVVAISLFVSFIPVKADNSDWNETDGNSHSVGSYGLGTRGYCSSISYTYPLTSDIYNAAGTTQLDYPDQIVTIIAVNFENYVSGTVAVQYFNPYDLKNQSSAGLNGGNKFRYQMIVEGSARCTGRHMEYDTYGFNAGNYSSYTAPPLSIAMNFVLESCREFTITIVATPYATTDKYNNTKMPSANFGDNMEWSSNILDWDNTLEMTCQGDGTIEMINLLDLINQNINSLPNYTNLLTTISNRLNTTNEKLDDLIDAINTQTQIITDGFDTIHQDLNQQIQDNITDPFEDYSVEFSDMVHDNRTPIMKSNTTLQFNKITRLHNMLLDALFNTTTTGINIFNPSTMGDNKNVYLYNTNKVQIQSGNSGVIVPIEPNTTYTVNPNYAIALFRIGTLDRVITQSDGSVTCNNWVKQSTNTPITFTSTSTDHYLYIQLPNASFNAIVNNLTVTRTDNNGSIFSLISIILFLLIVILAFVR